jgi:hypothetical protein
MEHIVCMGEMRNVYKDRRLLGRPRHRWDLKICLSEVRLEGVDRINMAQNRNLWWAFMNTVMNLQDP